MSQDKRQRFHVNRVDTQDQRGDAETTHSPPIPDIEEICDSPTSPPSDLEPNMGTHSGTLSGTHSGTQSTFRSLRQLTREALPRLDHYRNLASIMHGPEAHQRPTLDDLHQPPPNKVVGTSRGGGGEEEGGGDGVKFGWVQGVLVRCLLNIWGVILFLRLPWVVGQAGVLEALLIVTCGNVVTTITALSMSAISTNGQIKAGGTYYMISRSLGPELGGAIGLLFSLATAVAASMYVVGFCESLNDLLGSHGLQVIDGDVNDVRLVGSITLVVLFAICVIGMEWEARAQVVLLVVLVVAIVDFVIGVFVGPLNDDELSRGFVGLNGSVLAENLYSDYRSEGQEADGEQHQGFFTVFSVFFPACTGILAGANISGDLKDPSNAIPKGTLLAILVTYASYLVILVLSGAVMVRDATGNVTQAANWSFTNCTDTVCEYGLVNSSQVMELVSVFGPLVYAGCFAATLSSALASIVSAPKVFQALCKDRLYPYIQVFGKGYGRNDEPYLGYVLAFIIILLFTLLARLDSIAPIITNFFLAAYALINLSTFHASLQHIPSWRPTFKYYNKWLSLIGGVMCTAIMFLIQWWTALLTLTIIILLYLIVAHRRPDVNWGSSTQAQMYSIALSSVMSLSQIEEHVKTYRPQILVLCGAPSARPPLLHFAYSITKNMSLLVVGHCLKDQQSQRERSSLVSEASEWLSQHKVRAFYALADGPSMELAARTLMCTVGLGKLRPNLVLMGYKATWHSCPAEELHSYFTTIHYAFGLHLAVGILRVEDGLDYSNVTEMTQDDDDAATYNAQNTIITRPPKPVSSNLTVDPEPAEPSVMPSSSSAVSFGHYQCEQDPCSSSSAMTGYIGDRTSPPLSPTEDGHPSFLGALKMSKKKLEPMYKLPDGERVPPHTVDAMLRFTRKQAKGTIDVWWLYDDGGLTMLIPYILTTRAVWSSCKLRVFCLANKKDDLASEHRRMIELLCKFRIDFSDVVMVPDVTRRPREESIKDFNNLISGFKVLPDEDAGGNRCDGITEAELVALKDKTNRHIRLRELLLEHSREASFIVMTLPIPALGTVSAPLYMAWLETLTHQMPPFLLLRGNQTSVLTFYS
ncbi:bumetanide-sensitive sodium-(potassium)-chloride cotransporter-like isoform X2 [Homarus americanus]|uniref:bumetanide-sensitive sodium-(potassium)-chloride cotransporter-like isoform X2 n=1 Tax=Homarus americanus TaxID=6706 RepID=UPI001C44504F|nr:bumetanide-sensitive sodium-(potassium)-chloride cotransporter-like isoform X2 [Homarus americanus]